MNVYVTPDHDTTLVSSPTVEILGTEFDLDQLNDIATHGMQQGVSGFIYSSELHDIYEANEATIWDALDELADDLGEKNGFRMVITALENKGYDTWQMQDVKEFAVWMYVEHKAYNELISNEHPDWV